MVFENFLKARGRACACWGIVATVTFSGEQYLIGALYINFPIYPTNWVQPVTIREV